MTCKDCIHYEVCLDYVRKVNRLLHPQKGEFVPNEKEYTALCEQFTANANIIELPCPVGTTIYMIVEKRAKVTMSYYKFIKTTTLTYFNMERVLAAFGRSVFLTFEEAKKAIKQEEDHERQ